MFETVERGRQAHYKLTSTVMLHLVTRRGSENDAKSQTDKKPDNWKRDGEVSLSGSMTRQASLCHIILDGCLLFNSQNKIGL